MTKYLGLCMLSALLLAGCGKKTEIQYADLSYLDPTALEEIGSYSDIIDDEYKESMMSYEGEFVRWTATISKVGSDKKFTLKEDELPKVEVKLRAKPSHSELKVGDLVTVSAKVNKYEYGFFSTVPVWTLTEAKVLETTEADKESVRAFQQAYSDKVKGNDIAEKEQAEKEQVEQAEKSEKEKLAMIKFYQSDISPELDAIGKEYDAIWADLWTSTFNGVNNGTIDAYTAYENMKLLDLHYSNLQSRVSDIDGYRFRGDAVKTFKSFISEYYSAINNRISAAKKAMKMFDNGTYKPSEVEKVNSIVHSADQKLIKALGVRLQLEESLGILEK